MILSTLKGYVGFGIGFGTQFPSSKPQGGGIAVALIASIATNIATDWYQRLYQENMWYPQSDEDRSDAAFKSTLGMMASTGISTIILLISDRDKVQNWWSVPKNTVLGLGISALYGEVFNIFYQLGEFSLSSIKKALSKKEDADGVDAPKPTVKA